ncbi:MAG: hypothetical protein WA210_00890 [Burkholderiaceae bacterium]
MDRVLYHLALGMILLTQDVSGLWLTTKLTVGVFGAVLLARAMMLVFRAIRDPRHVP